ncbi:MAG: hypothetical protein ABI813_12430 [Bacteroidota bacterium]
MRFLLFIAFPFWLSLQPGCAQSGNVADGSAPACLQKANQLLDEALTGLSAKR